MPVAPEIFAEMKLGVVIEHCSIDVNMLIKTWGYLFLFMFDLTKKKRVII